MLPAINDGRGREAMESHGKAVEIIPFIGDNPAYLSFLGQF
jgi:hypothetical protein